METNNQKKIMLAVSEAGAIIFRNNTGMGWAGKLVKRTADGGVYLANARPLHAGLCKGSSDLIGFKTVEITPDMVGKKIAVFTAIEVKDVGKKNNSSNEQKNFIKSVKKAGGFAGVADSVDSALEILNS